MRYCANNGCMNGLQPNLGVSAGMNRVRRIIDNEYPIAMAYDPWQRWGETMMPKMRWQTVRCFRS